MKNSWPQRIGLGIGGLAVGIAVATAASAYAAAPSTDTAAGTPASGAKSSATAPANRDESKAQRPDEKLLTGDAAKKATAAALAKYPGAKIQRVETDSDGVYEAHLTTAAGARVTVEMDKNFKVTGEEKGGPGGQRGPGGPDGQGGPGGQGAPPSAPAQN